jgi:predicted  nucleic acid-binding Zn-ribbon protein
MTNIENGEEFHLNAENASLKVLLEGFRQSLTAKNQQYAVLQQQTLAAAEQYSDYESRFEELEMLKNRIRELMQKAEGAVERESELEKEVSLSISTSFQLEEIRSQYKYLQVQLNDLTERLHQLINQNIMQQQYAGRIAELESLLANAEEEIETLKSATDPQP